MNKPLTPVPLEDEQDSFFDRLIKNLEALAHDPNHPARQATKDHLAKTGGWGLDEDGNKVFTPPSR